MNSMNNMINKAAKGADIADPMTISNLTVYYTQSKVQNEETKIQDRILYSYKPLRPRSFASGSG